MASPRATAALNADPEIADQQRSSLATDGEAQVSVWTELVLVFLHLASDLDDATFTLFLPLLFPGKHQCERDCPYQLSVRTSAVCHRLVNIDFR